MPSDVYRVERAHDSGLPCQDLVCSERKKQSNRMSIFCHSPIPQNCAAKSRRTCGDAFEPVEVQLTLKRGDLGLSKPPIRRVIKMMKEKRKSKAM